MKNRPNKGPKQLGTFLNKYRAVLIIVAAFFINVSVFCQSGIDTTRPFTPQSTYGFEYKNIRVNLSMRIPRDTLPLSMPDSGCIAIVNKGLWLWNGYNWDTLQVSSISDPIVGENIGNGFGIYKNREGNTLRFRTISAGENVILTPQGDSLLIGVIAADGNETKIIAGANVIVSGEGTIASPYIITSIPSPGMTSVSHDTTLTGAGTSVDTLRVNTLTVATVARLNDSIAAVRAIITTPALQQVTDAGNTTTNPIVSSSFFYADDGANGYGRLMPGGVAIQDGLEVNNTLINSREYSVTDNVTGFYTRMLWPQSSPSNQTYVVPFKGNGTDTFAMKSDIIEAAWLRGGNTVGSPQALGTIDNQPLPIITNNTERARFFPSGNIGIGTVTDDAANKLQISGTQKITAISNASCLSISRPAGSFNGNWIDLTADNDGFTVLNFTNTSAGASAGSTLRFSNNGGLKTQAFLASTTSSYGNSAFVFDQLAGNIHFASRAGVVQFSSGNITGAVRLEVSVANTSVKNVLNLAAVTPPASTADAAGIAGDLRRDADGNMFMKGSIGWLKLTGSRYATVATTDATPATILTVSTVTAFDYEIEFTIDAKNATTGDRSMMKRLVRYKNIGGTLTAPAGGAMQAIGSDWIDPGLSGVTVSVTTSGANILIQPTGLAATTLAWSIEAEVRKL